jgi:hypothetical protein
MRIVPIFAVSLFVLTFVWGDNPSLAAIDFSEARITQAGPESFYIRSVGTPSGKLSLHISRDPRDGAWRIVEIIPEDRNILPEGMILDFATLRQTGDSSLEIGGILHNGVVYKGEIKLDIAGNVYPPDSFVESRFSDASLRRAAVLKDLMLPGYDEQVKKQFDEEKKVLLDKIDRLTESGETLKKEIQLQKETISVLARQRDEGSASKNTDRMRISELEKKNNELIGETGVLKARLAEISGEGEKLKTRLSETAAALDAARASAAAEKAKAEVRVRLEPAESRPPAASGSVLEERVAFLEQEVEILHRKVSVLSNAGDYRIDRGVFSKALLTGFSGARPKLGTWKVTAGQAEQTDGKQYFAKLALPVRQENKRTLYSFQTRAAGKGWVGVGLHIFVEDTVKPRGYGEGKSLLVWMTRDPDANHNDASYLQLYRSDNDIHMERVLDAKIPESLANYINVDILYDPVAEYITIALNGVEKVRYKTFFGIDSGVSVALRTLGAGGSFKNLSVATLP